MSQWFTSWGNEKEPKGCTLVSSLPRGVEGVTRTQAAMAERAVNRQEGVCPQSCWPGCLDLVLEAGNTRWLAYSAYFLSTVTLGTQWLFLGAGDAAAVAQVPRVPTGLWGS